MMNSESVGLNAQTDRGLLTIGAAFLILLVGACGGGGEDLPDSVQEIDRGVRLLQDGHLEQAYDVFDSVIRDDPRNAEAYARRGFAQLALGSITGGLADINRALEIDPEFALAHNYKGVVFDMNGIEEQAILEFTRAIELAPGMTDAYVNRSRVYLEMSDGESALADMNTALTLDPENTELLLIRAQTYLTLGDWSRAEADLEQVLSLPAEDHTISAARQILSIIQ